MKTPRITADIKYYYDRHKPEVYQQLSNGLIGCGLKVFGGYVRDVITPLILGSVPKSHVNYTRIHEFIAGHAFTLNDIDTLCIADSIEEFLDIWAKVEALEDWTIESHCSSSRHEIFLLTIKGVLGLKTFNFTSKSSKESIIVDVVICTPDYIIIPDFNVNCLIWDGNEISIMGGADDEDDRCSAEHTLMKDIVRCIITRKCKAVFPAFWQLQPRDWILRRSIRMTQAGFKIDGIGMRVVIEPDSTINSECIICSDELQNEPSVSVCGFHSYYIHVRCACQWYKNDKSDALCCIVCRGRTAK